MDLRGSLHNLFILFAGGLTLAACSESRQLSSGMQTYIQLDTIEVTSGNDFYRSAATRDFDLLHTELHINFDWENQHVEGEAYLRLKPYFYEESSLVLDAKGFDIHNLGIAKDKTIFSLPYTYDSSRITIDLLRSYDRDDTLNVYLKYTAKPELLIKKEPSLKDNKGLYFIDPFDKDPAKPQQIWTQGETESSSCWFPTIDHPNERCTQDIFITVDKKFTTLSNGLLKSGTDNEDGSRTDHWKQLLPHAPYLFVVVVGEYSVVGDRWRKIEVDYYVEPKFKKHAKSIFGHTPEMLEFYSDYFGVDYPWEKYHQVVVRDFVAGAMENTSATVHFEGLHKTKRDMLDGDHEDIIAHEVVHQWFGNLVTCESWSNIPLNESFATYGEYLWFEHKYGKEEADLHLHYDLLHYLNEAKSKQEPLIRYYYDHPDDMFDRHSYQKGGRVLHMLRNYIGEEAFKQSLKLYLKENAFQAAEIDNLRLAFEKVTGEDLHWFFDQWFMTAGHPQLIIDYSYDEDSGKVIVRIEQSPSFPSSGLYRLPIKIDMYTETTRESKEVTLKDKVTEVSFISLTEPKLINVDADKMLLCEKEDNKTLDAWVYQYENAPLMMDRYEALSFIDEHQMEPEAYETMRTAINDPFHYLREKAIANIEVKEEDKDEITQLLRTKATEDPESGVRAEALYKLTELEPEFLEEVLVEALNDSSFQVIATSIESLIDVDAELALMQADKCRELENFDLQSAVAAVYSELGGREYFSFFEESIQGSSGYLKYNYLYYFGNFLSRMEIEQVKDGIPLLKETTISSSNKWIKIAGLEALERIKSAYQVKKENASLQLKDTDNRDLGKIAELEDSVKNSNAVLELVDHTLSEIEMMN